ncbi:MAG: type 4a pilus biogenesis protein PilO [Candidatus Paceibacterota bacterium]
MKTKHKTILYSLALLLWMGLLVGLLVYPLWNKVESSSIKLKETQEKITEVETQSRQLHNLQESLNKAKRSLKSVDNLFINKEAPVGFLGFLEETAADSNVDIDISPSAGQKKKKEPWPPTFFSVNGVGSFEECIEFVKKLEHAPYLLRIQSLSLGEAEQSEKNVKVKLIIKVY